MVGARRVAGVVGGRGRATEGGREEVGRRGAEEEAAAWGGDWGKVATATREDRVRPFGLWAWPRPHGDWGGGLHCAGRLVAWCS